MERTSLKVKEIYIDPSGEDYYSRDKAREANNRYAERIKIEDPEAFEKQMVHIKKPGDLAQFILIECFDIDLPNLLGRQYLERLQN